MQVLEKLTIGGDEVIGTAIDQKPIREGWSHYIGCRTAMWKERRNHRIIISKQRPKYYDEVKQIGKFHCLRALFCTCCQQLRHAN